MVLTGGVSRGVADQGSDGELLLVPVEHVGLEAAFAMAGDAGLQQPDPGRASNTDQAGVGDGDGAPLELSFWPRDYAESSVDALLAGEPSSAADALAHGIPLRTLGVLGGRQQRLRR